MIAVVDYGIGNIHSLMSALGEDVVLTADPKILESADCVILPGVGAYKYAMSELEVRGLIPVLRALKESGKMLVGICLGMQLFYDSSDEHGFCEGLGFLKGRIKVLPDTVKIPHMGWNELAINQSNSKLLENLNEESYVYFVHSYYASNIETETLIASTGYGDDIPAIVRSKNVIGFQFHPEKSGEVGRQLIKNLKKLIKEQSL